MSAFIFILIFTALFALAGVASAQGRTPDTRDPDWTVGKLLGPRQ